MSTRLKVQVLSADWGSARLQIDEQFRALREVLLGGFRWSEQVRSVVSIESLDPSQLPQPVDVPGMKSTPSTVLLLRATEVLTPTHVSGGTVTWEWRAGSLLLTAVSALTSGTRYDCLFAVME